MNSNTGYIAKNSGAPDRYGYILHLWSCTDQWRASLVNLETRQRYGFENLEQLFTYLIDLVEGNLQEQQKSEKEQKNGSELGTTSCEG